MSKDMSIYPEDIEDLVVKKDGIIVEAVQVKNISATLTLSSLALTKTSTGGEGFFNRMCSIHAQNPSFNAYNLTYAGYGRLNVSGVFEFLAGIGRGM